MRAQINGRAVTVEPPEGEADARPFLFVELEIDCEACGHYRLYLAGHYLRPVVSLLQEFLDAAPALTEEGTTVELESRERQIRFDPGNN